MIDRAARFDLALELAQPNRCLVGRVGALLERVEVGFEGTFARLRAFKLAARCGRDAPEFLVD